jgi:hypothetical protein
VNENVALIANGFLIELLKRNVADYRSKVTIVSFTPDCEISSSFHLANNAENC